MAASASTLLDQAQKTAHDYLIDAVKNIDEELGEGYAARHPELIAAYMSVAAKDFETGMMAQQLRAGLDAIAEAIKEWDGLEKMVEVIRNHK